MKEENSVAIDNAEIPRKSDTNHSSNKLLRTSASTWFTIAIIGQWLFVYYIIAFYGRSAINNNLQKWNEVLPHGFVSGDTMGNGAVALHLLCAAIIMGLGPLQFIGKIRLKFPHFHRVNGRIYVITAVLASLDGIYMLITRGNIGDIWNKLGTSSSAVLIVIFSVLAVKSAMAGQFTQHRKWALRLFMVVSTVWFFRIMLMLWLVIFQAPVGFDPEKFEGPFLTVLAFAQYLLPLLILEVFFKAEHQKNKLHKTFAAITIFFFSILTAVGVFGATMGMWLPRF